MTKYFSKNFIILFLVVPLVLLGCKKEETTSLTVSPETIEIPAEGGSASISITTDAGSWSIENPSDWISLSNTSGSQPTAMVSLNINSVTPEQRSATLIVSAEDAEVVEVVVTQIASDYVYSLVSNQEELTFTRAGNTVTFRVSSSAPSWSLSDDVDWLSYNTETGETGNTFVNVTALENPDADPRNAIITLQAEYAPDFTIEVTQNGELYPSYNTDPLPPDQTGMEDDAQGIANQMTLGWNIGNSLEASGGETGWGNPMVSSALIELVKENGFDAIRIPAAFNQYMEDPETAKISEEWLDRVKTVVQYCIDNDMYAILNIHWDGGWLENNVTEAAAEAVNAKQKAFWEQIATHLRDFDQRLLFASANEPHVENAAQMAVLLSYHQTFIDAVRSTGGKNAYRTLVVQGPITDIELTHNLMHTLPVDEVEDRMMVEIHYYTPWNFCGLTQNENWGNMFYYWGEGYHSDTDPDHNATYGEEDAVDYNFQLMKNQFADQGIPIILGEYGAIRRSALTGEQLELHLASRAYYFYYTTKRSLENGMIPFYWDNGHMGNHGFAIFNRINNTVFDQQGLDGLVQGAADANRK